MTRIFFNITFGSPKKKKNMQDNESNMQKE